MQLSGSFTEMKSDYKSQQSQELMSSEQQQLADSFRRWGYLQAKLDPFNRIPPFEHEDLTRWSESEAAKWREIYCGPVGIEFMHMPYPERCRWIAARMEGPKQAVNQERIFDRLLRSELFENFIHSRYIGAKRFSLEGLAVLIPLLDQILNRAAEQGCEIVMIGMSHRGRLNTIVHTVGSAPSSIFANFEDVDPRSVLGSGDVKYHKGATGTVVTSSGLEIDVHLASNPSHLEAINPVIQGRTFAKQRRLGDTDGKKVMAILLHGDAAFAGQGVTAESINLEYIPGFSVGGVFHIVLNNLIGFTAEPHAFCSSRYVTDVAKRLPIPIIHVNAEQPDEVIRVGNLAVDYRTEFGSSVVIDLIGYRRYGHNEADDPTVTQPCLYSEISDYPLLYENYATQIGMSKEKVEAKKNEVTDYLNQENEKGRAMTKLPSLATLPEYWGDYFGGPYNPSFEVPTGVSAERLVEVAKAITTEPAGFNIHPKLKKIVEQRLEMAQGKRAVDWGMAEALAFGTLLRDGTPVRLCGQDCRRGTFSHRNAAWIDQKTNSSYYPLQHLNEKQGKFEVYDSVLSEAAVVGFEYGFSRDYPETLVLWEAQFGDFGNGAQIIFDQFLAAGEDKWSLLSGMVILLPHGYEGAGPEHSSARMERFLQLAGEDNIQVCVPSTAGQYFHMLRRQALRKWQKPLIVFTPKSMLRAQAACSPVEELQTGSFQVVIPDEAKYHNSERLLFCSGKIAHQLRQERTKGGHQVGIATIEQIYPFPEKEVLEEIAKYPNLKSLTWVQEEPANMGALFFVRPMLRKITGAKIPVTSVKRSASASPATGSPKAHDLEQQTILRLAFANFQ